MKRFNAVIPALLMVCIFLLGTLSVQAQRIVYSAPGNDDTRRMNFEVIGKVGPNFLIYKNYRGKNYVSVYNNVMEEIDKVEQEYIPEDRFINVDFFPYNDFSYIVYQYQRKNVVYCNAVKVDQNGKKVSDIMTLDTSHISFTSSNRIYSSISSDNKEKLMVYKINSKNKSRFLFTTLLFDKELSLLKKSVFTVAMGESNDYVDKFSLDNEGDFVFSKFNRVNSEAINNTQLIWKAAQSDTLTYIPVPQDKIFLDELHVKVDNFNNRYFLTSFYYEKKRGNIEGFYFFVWDKGSRQPLLHNAVVLGDDIRTEARGDATNRMAFNDYFVKNVVIKKNGGFLINTESYYTSSRTGTWNRWNYLYGAPMSTFDYQYLPYNSWGYRNRYYGSPNVRHHSDNVTILSFDNTGKLEWSEVIHKEQFDDETDDRLSFITANTGSQLHYLFNVDERRALLLNDFTLSPDGKLSQNPTLKNLDRGYEFMPRFGKQVSANQLIIPCYYRNNICFAKIEFN